MSPVSSIYIWGEIFDRVDELPEADTTSLTTRIGVIYKLLDAYQFARNDELLDPEGRRRSALIALDDLSGRPRQFQWNDPDQ
jgi:hypothetical protein